MKKLVVILFVALLAAGIMSALYMQINLYQGEPYYYAPHEYNAELAKIINQKDMLYVPIWAMIFAITIALGYHIFRLFVSEHSYYSTLLYVVMIGLYLAAIFILFKAYNVIGRAQVLTGKTAEYLMGFFEMMNPFLLILVLCGLVEIIKWHNLKTVPEDSIDIQRFNILKSILMKRHHK